MRFSIQFPLFNEAGDGGNGGSGGGDASTILTTASHQSNPVPPGNGDNNGNEGASFDFRTALDDKGGFKSGWTEALPDDLKDFAGAYAKYPNLTEAMRALGHSQKTIGQRQQLKPPGADAKPEEIAAWRKTLGVPDAPEGYGITKPEKLPEGVQWDDKTAGDFSKLSHEIGLTPTQAKALFDFDMKRMEGMHTTGKAKLDAFLNEQRGTLQKEWGDKFEDNKSRALSAAKALGLDPADAEIGNSAKMIKALYAASNLMKEDSLFRGGNSGPTGDAAAEDIRRNPNNPLHKAYKGEEGKERQQFAAAEIMRLCGVKAS